MFTSLDWSVIHPLLRTLALGQVLSLCLVGTGSFSEVLFRQVCYCSCCRLSPPLPVTQYYVLPRCEVAPRPVGLRTPSYPMRAQLRPTGRGLRHRGLLRQGWQRAASTVAEVCGCCFSGRASQLCHRDGLSLHLADQRHVAGLCDNPRCGDGQLYGCTVTRSQGTKSLLPLQHLYHLSAML